MKSTKNKLLRISSILAFLGFIDSIYLTVIHYINIAPVCNITTQCEMILTSRFSAIGPIPLALVGVLYYLTFTILSIYLTFVFNKKVFQAIFIITTLGFIVSVLLVMIQAFVLGAFCQYCLLSETISAILFFLVLKIRKTEKLVGKSQKLEVRS